MKPVITRTPVESRVRVRLQAAPCCGRPLVLDHCATDDGTRPDEARVAFAQSLHLATCTG